VYAFGDRVLRRRRAPLRRSRCTAPGEAGARPPAQPVHAPRRSRCTALAPQARPPPRRNRWTAPAKPVPGEASSRSPGQGAIAAFAARTGLGEEKVVELLTALPRPTHEDFKQTFFRLYSDRVLATLGVIGGAARLLFGGVGGAVGGAMALSSALYLHRSVKSGVDRGYGATSRAASVSRRPPSSRHWPR
jgi:hypothetical protein